MDSTELTEYQYELILRKKHLKLSEGKIPAVVIGSDITALGVIRSLSRVGIPTFIISHKNDFVRYSRWAKPIRPLVKSFPTTDELADILNQLQYERAVLFPCSDPSLLAVADLSPELKELFPSCLPSKKTIESLVHKGKFAEVLRATKVPHPKTIILENSDQIEKEETKYLTNFFIKPFHSWEFQHHFGTKSFRILNVKDALDKFHRAQNAGQQVMLQEYIPGPAHNHYFIDGFIDRLGRMRALFVRRRIRIYPKHFGNSSYCVSIPKLEAAPAVESIVKIMNDIGYRGIFSAEFKFDERDNLFKILEINARPWWYVEFASQFGVNTCYLAYKDALGVPVASISEYVEGAGCMHVFNDLRAIIMTNGMQKVTLKHWLWELLTSKKPIYSWDDPLPAIFNLIYTPYNYVRNRL